MSSRTAGSRKRKEWSINGVRERIKPGIIYFLVGIPVLLVGLVLSGGIPLTGALVFSEVGIPRAIVGLVNLIAFTAMLFGIIVLIHSAWIYVPRYRRFKRAFEEKPPRNSQEIHLLQGVVDGVLAVRAENLELAYRNNEKILLALKSAWEDSPNNRAQFRKVSARIQDLKGQRAKIEQWITEGRKHFWRDAHDPARFFGVSVHESHKDYLADLL